MVDERAVFSDSKTLSNGPLSSGVRVVLMSSKPREYTASSLSVELEMDRRKVGQLLAGLSPHREDER